MLALLALSGAVIAARGGLTYLLAMMRVVREAARDPPAPPPGIPIIVLGVHLPKTACPRPEYRERLDRGATELARARGAEIAILGGVTRPGLPSEADAGKDYLIRHRNLPPERIQCERRSHHTLENLRFWRAGSTDHGGAIILVTSRFHMARACLLAHGLGLTVYPAPSDGGAHGALRVLVRLPWEALLIHWYIVGRTFARVTGNARMIARIS